MLKQYIAKQIHLTYVHDIYNHIWQQIMAHNWLIYVNVKN